MDEFESACRRSAALGRKRFTGWDDDRFASWQDGLLAAVWAALPSGERQAVLEDLLMLVVDGIGRGTLGGGTSGPQTFLEGLLQQRAIPWLCAAQHNERPALLATLWNLGEGPQRGAAWLDQYLLARIDEVETFEGLASTVTLLLKPMLSVTATIRWAPPYNIDTIDLRAADPQFLPGDISLIAPRLVCVADRRRDVRLGVLFTDQATAQIIVNLAAVAPIGVVTGAPAVALEGSTLHIDGQRVVLPLNEPAAVLASPAGFVAVTARNSQRLWIVEPEASRGSVGG